MNKGIIGAKITKSPPISPLSHVFNKKKARRKALPLIFVIF